MSREQRAELELLRKSNEVQLLELECLRADCSLHQGTINHYEAEVERLRAAGRTVYAQYGTDDVGWQRFRAALEGSE